MPKDSSKKLGICLALFFTLVAALVYFLKPSESHDSLPEYLGRMSALKAYDACKTGQKCVKTHVITNLKMVNSRVAEFTTTPYTSLYTCVRDRLSACRGGRLDESKLSSLLADIKNSRCSCYLFGEDGTKTPLPLDKGVFMNSDKVFGVFLESPPRLSCHVSLVVEQYS